MPLAPLDILNAPAGQPEGEERQEERLATAPPPSATFSACPNPPIPQNKHQHLAYNHGQYQYRHPPAPLPSHALPTLTPALSPRDILDKNSNKITTHPSSPYLHSSSSSSSSTAAAAADPAQKPCSPVPPVLRAPISPLDVLNITAPTGPPGGAGSVWGGSSIQGIGGGNNSKHSAMMTARHPYNDPSWLPPPSAASLSSSSYSPAQSTAISSPSQQHLRHPEHKQDSVHLASQDLQHFHTFPRLFPNSATTTTTTTTSSSSPSLSSSLGIPASSSSGLTRHHSCPPLRHNPRDSFQVATITETPCAYLLRTTTLSQLPVCNIGVHTKQGQLSITLSNRDGSWARHRHLLLPGDVQSGDVKAWFEQRDGALVVYVPRRGDGG